MSRDRLRRLHRKLACIDGTSAFIGGINILDDHWDPNHGALEHPRLDYSVRVDGPIAEVVHSEMQALWAQLAQRPLRRVVDAGKGRVWTLARRFRRRREAAYLALRDNVSHRREIERAYLQAIGRARHEVLIANAYFFPGRRFRRALRAAAGRGVKVRLLLQGRIEYVLPHRAAQALYESLLASGIEIVEYHRSFLHAKVAVIDDWATVGSSNIDPFSLLLAREANLVIRDAAFAADLRERLMQAMNEGGRVIAVDEQGRRPLWQRLWGWTAYGLLRLGVVVSGERPGY
jgi:cardiolipin synthase